MSGNLAARYISGLPYDPSLGVSAYSRAPRLAAPTGTASLPGGALTLPIDATGRAVRVPAAGATLLGSAMPTAALIGEPTASGVAGGGNDGLISALLSGAGLLQYLPDAYNAVSDWLSPEQAYDAGGGDYAPDATVGPWGLPVVPFGGADFGYVPPGSSAWSPAGGQGVIWDPNGSAGQLGTTNGWTYPGDAGGGSASVLDGGVGGASNWTGVPASATAVDVGLGAGTAADLATGAAYAPAALFARGTSSFAKPGGELGGQIGSTLGGILGGVVAGPWGAAAGTIAGGAIGGQIGPAPTVGRNFSSIGTFDGSGGLNWGNAGGDNGGNANDATSFADWFGGNLAQQAAAQGLSFNPNMSGAQIRVGGYDNFNRTGRSPAGGYFYDITNQGGQFGGSPEQYALRPSDDFASDPFSTRQADAFTANVLADLAARNVFTPGGAAIGGQGDLMGTLGTGYGWYGGLGSDYSQIEYGGSGGFNDILGGRQNAITGYMNDQQQQARQAAAVANTAQGFTDQGYVPAAFDLSQPIWFNGGIVNPGEILFPTQAANSNPWGAVGVDAGLIDPGLFGQQADGGA